MCLGTEEVRVPYTEQTTNDGNVLLERCLLEMFVHSVGTSKELVEVVEANVEGNTQANGTPDTVTSTDPVGEAKHVLLVNTKLGNLCLIGRESDKVLGNVLLLCAVQEPSLGSIGVGDSLSCGESLGGNEEEGSLGVGVLESLCNVCAVNVGDEVDLEVALSVGLEGF